MAWEQKDLDKIDAALKSGNLLLSFGDRKVRRYDFDDLMKLRVMIWNTLQKQKGIAVPCLKTCHIQPQRNI